MSVITLGKFTNRNRDLLNKLTSLDYVEKVKDKENTYVIDYSKIDDKMWNEYRDYVYERGVRRVVDGEIERRDLTPEEKEKLPFHYFTGNKGEKNVVLYCNGECKFDGCYKNGDVSKTNFSKNRKVLPDISHITDNLNKTNETDFEL